MHQVPSFVDSNSPNLGINYVEDTMEEISFDVNISSREDQPALGIVYVEDTMEELSCDINMSSREDQPVPQLSHHDSAT